MLFNKASFCREIETKIVTHPGDVDSGAICVKNQVEYLKTTYRQAKEWRDRTGAGNTSEHNLECQLLAACPHYYKLEPILDSTYGRENEVVSTGDSFPAEIPEADEGDEGDEGVETLPEDEAVGDDESSQSPVMAPQAEPPVKKSKKKKLKSDGIIESIVERISESRLQRECMKQENETERLKLRGQRQDTEARKANADIEAARQATEMSKFHMYKELGFTTEQMIKLLGLPCV